MLQYLRCAAVITVCCSIRVVVVMLCSRFTTCLRSAVSFIVRSAYVWPYRQVHDRPMFGRTVCAELFIEYLQNCLQSVQNYGLPADYLRIMITSVVRWCIVALSYTSGQ